jgi:hypothetical protein
MNIAFLIIGLIVVYLLWSIALNQKVICSNQVKQAKLFEEIILQIKNK